ncbi:MAG: HD domain-containing protein [Micrococcales bacterium]|nr:HD domain-containing protein [Micrococcales bacterium]
MTLPAPGSHAVPALARYILGTTVLAVALAVVGWQMAPAPEPTWLVLLCAMGALSWNLREDDVGTRVSISFLSIILLTSTVIVGPFGAAVVGAVSVALDLRPRGWSISLFNMAMSAIIGASGGLAYVLVGGESDVASLTTVVALTAQVGAPLLVADLVQCVTNAALVAGVIRVHRGIPFLVVMRGVLLGSGLAYVGYGVIGFLFVVLWFPAQLGPFSAVLILAPLLAARWAFIQYGDEMRAHERVIDTLVTALRTKAPPAAGRAWRCARVAEWIAEEMGLGPHQIETVRYAGTLHEIGQLGVSTRLLRRDPATLTPEERRVIAGHPVTGARMIQGIDFLEGARAAIRFQSENFDGSGGPAGLSGSEIPLSSRIVAVAVRFDALTSVEAGRPGLSVADAVGVIEGESGSRFDPVVVAALRDALGKQAWPPVSMGVPS